MTNSYDSTCVLGGSWGANQTAQAVVHVVTSGATQPAKVEIRLHTTIATHSITGYEINCSVKSGDPYLQIVRWNGPLGSFTLLGSRAIGCADGDIFKAASLGSTISAYKNGVLILSVSDSTYAGGSPGMGFYKNGSDFGFSSFTATAEPAPRSDDLLNTRATPGKRE
jgi:hypothetical protein